MDSAVSTHFVQHYMVTPPLLQASSQLAKRVCQSLPPSTPSLPRFIRHQQEVMQQPICDEQEFEINDVELDLRVTLTRKKTHEFLLQRFGCYVTVKGSFVPPGGTPPAGEKPLHLLVKAGPQAVEGVEPAMTHLRDYVDHHKKACVTPVPVTPLPTQQPLVPHEAIMQKLKLEGLKLKLESCFAEVSKGSTDGDLSCFVDKVGTGGVARKGEHRCDLSCFVDKVGSTGGVA
ncbi:hypothetical protein CYMTET_56658 [Cymbomonas tetramitiformis]|uniref:ATP-dependent RNA helicase PRP5/DDX46/KHDC4 KH domain-containing protein n=1 Tax=Cymbomonas tetramitiformis TaxID=36881 RepID=A0AAE0BBS9_9CHLO|nr:hypothetical protein CYMTET_56658 [Cymbomonas tetramitiformis]